MTRAQRRSLSSRQQLCAASATARATPVGSMVYSGKSTLALVRRCRARGVGQTRDCTPRAAAARRWRALRCACGNPNSIARHQVCRVSAVSAGLLYGAVKSTYLQTFKARLAPARCRVAGVQCARATPQTSAALTRTAIRGCLPAS